MNYTFLKIPEGCEGKSIPALCEEDNALRFSAVESILGSESKTGDYLKSLGSYELADSLAHELRLKGVELGERGEFPAMSPKRWRSLPAADVSWDNVSGILLNEQKIQEFQRFLASFPQDLSCTEMCKIARHYFYEESLVLVVVTRPRVSL